MKMQLNITGMSCSHCANHVKAALSELSGASDISVDLENNCAYLELREALPEAALREAIVQAGYQLSAVEQIDTKKSDIKTAADEYANPAHPASAVK